MKTKIFFYLFVLASLVIACVSEYKANLPYSNDQVLIVDGNIMEDTTVIFYLSKSFSMDTAVIPQESFDVNAVVTIIGGNGYESPPATYLGEGAYSMDIGKLDDNVKYGIQIVYDGNTYQSELSNPITTPEIDSVSWIQPENNGAVSLRVSTHDETSEEAKFFMWDYAETWEFAADYVTTTFFNPDSSTFYTITPPPFYYCWRNNVSHNYIVGSTESLKENRIINKQIIQYDSFDERFSILYSVMVNQKAISKGAYDYYQNKIKLNEEMGGLFSPQPSEVNGNITCITNSSKRVMGYVEVTKNTTHQRMFVYRNQLTRPMVYSDCVVISNDSVLKILGAMNITYADFYQQGFRPAGAPDPDPRTSMHPSGWSTASCTNCTANGGSKTKPDYWPNDDQ